MKIYIATSWKNKRTAKTLARLLKEDGHEVDCFCDPSMGRFVFAWKDLIDKEILKKHDAISFLQAGDVQRAFKEDKQMLDWADAVVMILPCGNSAHLEAGYAKGCGKKLFFIGPFHRGGRLDVMYGFADRLFRWPELSELRTVLGGR